MIIVLTIILLISWYCWYRDIQRLDKLLWLKHCYLEELNEIAYEYAVQQPWLTREGDSY